MGAKPARISQQSAARDNAHWYCPLEVVNVDVRAAPVKAPPQPNVSALGARAVETAQLSANKAYVRFYSQSVKSDTDSGANNWGRNLDTVSY